MKLIERIAVGFGGLLLWVVWGSVIYVTIDQIVSSHKERRKAKAINVTSKPSMHILDSAEMASLDSFSIDSYELEEEEYADSYYNYRDDFEEGYDLGYSIGYDDGLFDADTLDILENYFC